MIVIIASMSYDLYIIRLIISTHFDLNGYLETLRIFMTKSIVIEESQLDNAVKIARSMSPENGNRDAAMLLSCFGTGLTVTEIARMQVTDYLAESGSALLESHVRAQIAYNGRCRPLFWTNKKVFSAIDMHLAERLLRGHGVSGLPSFRGLDPASPLFVSGRTGEGLKISAQMRDGKIYYSANQLSRLFTRIFAVAGVEGASAQSGRRTLAVKLARQGVAYEFISELLGIESLTAVKKLCSGAQPCLRDIFRGIG